MDRVLKQTPIVDLTAVRRGSPAARAETARAVADACKDIGFFVAVGHGVPERLLDGLLAASRAFFDLPLEQKLACRPGPKGFLGYFGLASEKATTSDMAAPPDLKERFAIGRVDMGEDDYFTRPDARIYFQPNLWPESPSELKGLLCAYYREMEQLSALLMQLVAIGLGLSADHFSGMIDKQVSYLVSLNYPELGGLAPKPGQMRAGAHRDRACFTLVAADDGPGGLQVCRADGRWEDIPIPPGAFVVNTGSMMARWTNGAWEAPLHRVVNPPPGSAGAARRQSLAFFFNPNYDVLLRPLMQGPGFAGVSAEPITVGEHLKSMLDLHTRGLGSRDEAQGR